MRCPFAQFSAALALRIFQYLLHQLPPNFEQPQREAQDLQRSESNIAIALLNQFKWDTL
jgi:hypothetical protein